MQAIIRLTSTKARLIAKYILSGGATTAVYLAAANILLIFVANVELASILAYGVAAPTHFLINNFFTFSKTAIEKGVVLRYATFIGIFLVVNNVAHTVSENLMLADWIYFLWVAIAAPLVGAFAMFIFVFRDKGDAGGK